MPVLISNIQRFCTQDGPGIRTVIFLKGCNLNCPWCSNPENISHNMQYYFKTVDCIKEKTGCDLCQDCLNSLGINFPNEIVNIEVSSTNSKINDVCPVLAIGIIGNTMDDEELLSIISRDNSYYKTSNGGVTFSGGEPLLHALDIHNILLKLNNQKIHVAVETALCVESDLLNKIVDSIDLFIIDLKIINSRKAKVSIGADIILLHKNLDILLEKNKKYIFRVPLIKEYTSDDANIEQVLSLINKYEPEIVELFKIHTLASSKYIAIGKKMINFNELENEKFLSIQANLKKNSKTEIKMLNL